MQISTLNLTGTTIVKPNLNTQLLTSWSFLFSVLLVDKFCCTYYYKEICAAKQAVKDNINIILPFSNFLKYVTWDFYPLGWWLGFLDVGTAGQKTISNQKILLSTVVANCPLIVMEFQTREAHSSRLWHYLWQIFYIILIAGTLHYGKIVLWNRDFRYNPQTYLDAIDMPQIHCKKLLYEVTHLHKEIIEIKQQLEEIRSWKVDYDQNFKTNLKKALDNFYSDTIGIFDYASESAGGSIISTPETTSLPSRFGLRFFGTIDWVGHSDPGVLLQANTIPGKCYAFYGDKGRIRIKLGRPVMITHVSLEHIRIGESTTRAPKNFEIWAFGERGEENLGQFVYDLDDSIIQTFGVSAKNQTFRTVELRILSNHGNAESTCVYRFRVHSLN